MDTEDAAHLMSADGLPNSSRFGSAANPDPADIAVS
jgi:hypothetical protein